MAQTRTIMTPDNGLNSSKSTKLASIFQRNESKFLNLGLVIYLCFGVFVFELLGEFNQIDVSTVVRNDIHRPTAIKKESRNSTLVELRELSARRMWNITNRLNILYESNWTRLMLEELQEFERQLIDKLMVEASEEKEANEDDDEESDDDDDDDKDKDKNKDKDSEKKKSEKNKKNRIKSLKKSLIHSLSTITTVGYTQRIESSAGKLATVIYGLLGIPLLFCSVAKTGKQVAHSALNGLLIVRHYCFSLPIHYLCCACSLSSCFRCLLWCCCCCCCSYLWCCLANDKNKNKCCNSSKAPKLKLKKRRQSGKNFRGQSQDGATISTSNQQQQTAFIIGATSRGDNVVSFEEISQADRVPEQQQHQQKKSVKFMNNSKKSKPMKLDKKHDDHDHDHDSDDDDDDDNDSGYEYDDHYYTKGVFLTSLSALSLYLLLGAYAHSYYTNSTLIEALFVCYSMLSTSKFPGQTTQTSDQIYSDPSTLYQQINVTTKTTTTLKVTESFQSELIKWIYLLIGLNLISACGHFAKLWLSNKLKLKSKCPMSQQPIKKMASICNGGQIIQTLSGSFKSPAEISNNQQAPTNELQLSSSSNIGLEIVNHPVDHHYNTHQCNIYQQQQQQQATNQSQVDLSELFLVQSQQHNQDSSNSEMQFLASQIQQQQQQQQANVGHTPDMSLTSDRSTDRTSLCHHHQLQQNNVHQSLRPDLNESNTNLFTHNYNTNTIKQHHRHPSQSHLYLPTMQALDCGEQQQQISNHFILPNEINCDEADEMDLMLKNCNSNSGSSKLRSSSSSTQLSHLNTPIQNHQHHLSGTANNSSSTLSRIRSSFDKQNGQDSSLNNTFNDGSNTMSSTTSSRTVKLPHMRSNQHIGFILAPEHQSGHNKQ